MQATPRVALILLMLLVGACGQTGALYLPSEQTPGPASTSEAPPTPGPTADPDEDEEDVR